MKSVFDRVSFKISKSITRHYSTSFSFGIHMLSKDLNDPIYGIYGFVRVADEIVDSFHGYDKKSLLDRFSKDTFQAISEGISTNPVLQAYQTVVNKFDIDLDLVHSFLHSMSMDLEYVDHDRKTYEEYILGSAEVVGLMCLKVFVEGDEGKYENLKPFAMKLGAAFQKVNFLRDLREDSKTLGRTYFPQLANCDLDGNIKALVEEEIEHDFSEALQGIHQLPRKAKLGVYTAYTYYYQLFRKIKGTTPSRVMQERIRISNSLKVWLLIKSYLQLSTKTL